MLSDYCCFSFGFESTGPIGRAQEEQVDNQDTISEIVGYDMYTSDVGETQKLRRSERQRDYVSDELRLKLFVLPQSEIFTPRPTTEEFERIGG